MTPPPDLQHLIDTVQQDAGTNDAIRQLTVAAATAAQLDETTDALLGHFVDRCRHDGRSWSEISIALGVTKQAVHKRFATAVADQIVAAIPAPTLERFTARARNVLAAARRAATSANRASAGSEDLLTGLFAEPDGIAGQALAVLGVSQEVVQAGIAAARDAGSLTGPAKDSPGPAAGRFTEDGKRALRDALAVALELGHNYIGTEHLLLGLYRNADRPAARILTEAGAPEAAARALVSEMLRGFGQAS